MIDRRSNGNLKTMAIPRWLVALVDLALVSLGLYFAFVIVTGSLEGFQLEPLFILLPLISLVTVLLFSNLGLYSRQRSGLTPIVRALVTGVIGITLFSVLFAFWTRAFLFERTIFLFAPLLQFALLLGWRILYWRLELWIQGQKKLLVIGSREEAELALEKIMHLPRGVFEVVKVLEIERLDQLEQWLQDSDAVMIAGKLDMEQKNRVIRESIEGNREVFIVPDLYEIVLTRADMTQVHDTPVIECRDMQLTFLELFVKRLVDLTLAAIMSILALPVIALAGLAIYVESPGPVIFTQERTGLNGRSFILYKLRTMIPDAENESGPVLSNEEDDRVTRVGRFLRGFRLDELPQLYNVIRGDLSLVGPRPERPYFVERFQEEMPEYRLRHLVKPGITGLAQVTGYYATNTQDKLRYDLYYVAYYSLFMDFKILLLTIPTLFNREAAQGVRREVEKSSLYSGEVDLVTLQRGYSKDKNARHE